MSLSCRTCRTLHPVATAKNGVVECYLCGGRMRVPGQERPHETHVDSGNTTMDRPPQPTPSRPLNQATPEQERKRGKLRCPECKVALQVSAGYGKNVQCPLCTSWFRFEIIPANSAR